MRKIWYDLCEQAKRNCINYDDYYFSDQDFEFAFQAGWDAALKNAPEVLALLGKCEYVIRMAIEADLSMPKNKVVRMETADLEDLRRLGFAIHEMSEALTQWNKSTTKKREE